MHELDTLWPEIIDDLPMGYAYHESMFNEKGEPVDFIFLYVNKTFEELTGLKREEILGRRATAVLPGIREDFDWVAYYGEVAREGKKREFEHFVSPLHRWYTVKVYSPKPGYFITCFWDISFEKESLLEHEAYMSLANDMVVELNENYVVVKVWNKNHEILSLPLERIVGRSIRDLFPKDLLHLLESSLVEAKESKKRTSLEYPSLVLKELRWYSASFFYWVMGKKMERYTISFCDITKEKEKSRGREILLEMTDYLLQRPIGFIDRELYQVINSSALKIAKAKAAGFLSFDGRGKPLICRSLVSPEEGLAEVLKGLCLYETSLGDEKKEEKRLKERTLFEFKRDYKVSKNLQSLEKEHQIGQVISMSIQSSSKSIGQLLLFLPSDTQGRRNEQLQLFFSIVREYLQRLYAEEELQKSLERFEDVVLSMKVMICRFAPDTTLTFVNSAYSKMFSMDPKDLLGKRLLDLIPSCKHQKILTYIEQLTKEEPSLTYRSSITLPDGSIRWQEWAVRGFFNNTGALNEIQSVGLDITELMISRNEAIAASKAKSDFLTKISHELRTPLHAILSYAELGLEESKERSSCRIEERFSRIRVSARRLLYLIDDLLDIGMIETGSITYSIKRGDLYEAILYSREELLPLLAVKQISLEIIKPLFSTCCYYDREKILQVIRNLIHNGWKYSPAGSTIRIFFSLSSESKFIETHVENEGVRIPSRDLETIFLKFNQSAHPMNRSSGMGLGLAICQKIIEAQGGKIYAQNIKGRGARFTFLLPLKDLV